MIIDVVFALDLVVRMLEHTAEGIAQSDPAAMAHVHGARRVGGDKLHLDLLPMAYIAPAEIGALIAHRAEYLVVGGSAQIEVDEARTGNLNLRDLGRRLDMGNDGLGDLCGRHMRKACRAHGHCRGPVAVARLIRSLEAHILYLEGGKVSCLLRRRKGTAHHLLNGLGHLLLLLHAYQRTCRALLF